MILTLASVGLNSMRVRTRRVHQSPADSSLIEPELRGKNDHAVRHETKHFVCKH